MGRKFREWQPDVSWLFPPSPQDWLPEDHLVYFLLEVSQQVDTSAIVDDYDSVQGGQPPFHPRMMLVLLLYAYSVGVFSSRKIMQRCETDVAFRVIVGEDIPDFRRIAEFRKRHLQHMQPLFLEVLILCREAGLLNVGRLSLDGTKVKANASRHKAMSYDRMTTEVVRLQEEIDQLLAQANQADNADDSQFGDLRGDEIPAELIRSPPTRVILAKRTWNRWTRTNASTTLSWQRAARSTMNPHRQRRKVDLAKTKRPSNEWLGGTAQSKARKNTPGGRRSSNRCSGRSNTARGSGNSSSGASKICRGNGSWSA